MVGITLSSSYRGQLMWHAYFRRPTFCLSCQHEAI